MIAIPAYELFSFYELFQKRFLQLLRITLSHLLVGSDNSNFPVLFLAARRNNVTFVGRIFIR